MKAAVLFVGVLALLGASLDEPGQEVKVSASGLN